MGKHRHHRSVRTSVAFLGLAAAAASAFVVLGASVGLATAPADSITLANGNPGEALEGNAISNQVVAKFTDSGNPGGSSVANTDCSPSRYTAAITWGDGTTGTGTVACERPGGEVPNGTFDVTGSHTYADTPDAASYTIGVTVTDTKDTPNVTATGNTDTAAISDQAITFHTDTSNDGTYTTVEGSLTISVNFHDANPAFQATPDSIAATIDWGDGSAVQTVTPTAPPSSCACAGDFVVAASHSYDALSGTVNHYLAKVTAKDDGGSSATDSPNVIVSDAALTAGANKSLTATATQSSTAVVGSFTDAAGAQAAAADFTASIAWGDGATSAGTVTMTGSGAFNVGGTHTYASSGSKAITATVTDQEGKTVTLHATATVSTITLPTTGQPQPTQPSLPLIPIALLALGLISILAGASRLLVTRQR